MTLPSFGEPDADTALDVFLGQCLYTAGVWPSPRGGDGIARVRVMERSASRVRLLGRIWLIERQRQETFWLDLTEAPGGGSRVLWALHFGLVSLGRGRDVRDAVDLMTVPEDGVWSVLLDGLASNVDGRLRVIEARPSA